MLHWPVILLLELSPILLGESYHTAEWIVYSAAGVLKLLMGTLLLCVCVCVCVFVLTVDCGAHCILELLLVRVVNIAILYCNTQYCQYRFQYCQSIAILFENIYLYWYCQYFF